ncbi:hypothetical protein V1477_015284, partial [Vespula maculifrons]
PSRANGKFLLFARRISVICGYAFVISVKLDKGEDVIQRTLSRRKYSKTKEFSFAMSEKRARSSRRSIVKSELHLFEQVKNLANDYQAKKSLYLSYKNEKKKGETLELASSCNSICSNRHLKGHSRDVFILKVARAYLKERVFKEKRFDEMLLDYTLNTRLSPSLGTMFPHFYDSPAEKGTIKVGEKRFTPTTGESCRRSKKQRGKSETRGRRKSICRPANFSASTRNARDVNCLSLGLKFTLRARNLQKRRK